MVPVSPQNNAQLVMVYPPGNPGMHHHSCGSCHHRHKCKKHRKKEESDSDSDSDYEDEYYLVQNSSGQPYTYGDVHKAVIDQYGSKPKVREVVVAPPPMQAAGGGGSRKYEMFTPSHPQAVNQFVRDYNYKAKQNGHKREMQRYKQSLAEYQDRLAALEDYVDQQYMYDSYDYGYGGYDVGGYPQAYDNYDPYMDSGYY